MDNQRPVTCLALRGDWMLLGVPYDDIVLGPTLVWIGHVTRPVFTWSTTWPITVYQRDRWIGRWVTIREIELQLFACPDMPTVWCACDAGMCYVYRPWAQPHRSTMGTADQVCERWGGEATV